jgi:hypothetical protein
MGLGKRPSWVRKFICFVGFALMVGGAYYLSARSSDLGDPLRTDEKIQAFFWPFVGSSLIAAAAAGSGAWLVASVLASRLKVSVIAHDKEGKPNETTTGKLVSYLSELAGAHPRGLQIPYGTDVTALSGGALSELPSNKVLSALQKVFQTLLATIPWTVAIDESTDGALSVIITRNGWGVTAVSVNQTIFGLKGASPANLDKVEPDLQKMAAAVVVATLAQNHAGVEGLCGATNWRSIGFHYVATTDFQAKPEQAMALLGRALESDPHNLLAELALQYHRYRNSSDREELMAYINWTKSRAAVCKGKNGRIRPGHLNLYRRLLMNNVVAVLNLRDVQGNLHTDQQRDAVQHANMLMKALSGKRREQGQLRDVMRPVAAVAHRGLTGSTTDNAQWFDHAERSLAPWASYTMACHYASTFPLSDAGLIRKHLAVAFTRPELRVWARKDPSFLVLHAHKWFLELVDAKPRDDFWDIEPFASQKEKLRMIGVQTPIQLLQITPWRLQEYLETSPLIVNRLIRVAHLASLVLATAEASGEKLFKTLHVELTALLIEFGFESREQIISDTQVQMKIVDEISSRCLETISSKDVERWLETIVGSSNRTK